MEDDTIAWVPWCSLLLGTSLEVRNDLSRFTGDALLNSVTDMNVSLAMNLLGVFLALSHRQRIVSYSSVRLSECLLDPNINSPLTIAVNVFQVGSR